MARNGSAEAAGEHLGAPGHRKVTFDGYSEGNAACIVGASMK